MLEKIISLDKQLLVFLNSFGSKAFDPFWLIITKQSNWTPFFLILLFLIYKKFGTKQTFILLLFVTILLIINNNLTEIVKFHFERLRPCTDLDIKNIIRNVKPSATFSFYSGHASNSSATMIFLFLIFKKYYKHFWLVFIFPLVFAYSRIYLGLHFPIDILTGFAIGSTMGFLFYKMYQLIQKKYFNTVS